LADFFNDIYENINKDIDERYQKFEEENSQKPKFDMLKMYFGEDLVINEYIKVTQPTIGQILQDEKALWSSISPFTGNTTTYRVMLWQANLDWCKISNWEMFLLLYKSLTPDITWLIFDSYDFSKLEINGSEDGTPSVRLAGRNVDGSLPLPTYNVNEYGRVVVRIQVNRKGEVVSAIPGDVGTTTTNARLRDAAKQAALRARFNVAQNAPELQEGTITYNFRLR